MILQPQGPGGGGGSVTSIVTVGPLVTGGGSGPVVTIGSGHGAANTVAVTNAGGTASVFALLTNANIAAAGTANIAVNKLAPGGAGGVVMTDGTTVAYGLIVNANVAPAGTANIAVNKLAAGGAGDVLQTDGTTVFFAPFTPGDLPQDGATTGQALIWNVTTPGAWAPGTDFAAQNLTTTGAFISNAGEPTGFLQLGVATGSGAGTPIAATAGSIRGARSAGPGIAGFRIFVRDDADTVDVAFATWHSDTAVVNIGDSTSVAEVNLRTNTEVVFQIGTQVHYSFTIPAATFGLSGAFQLQFQNAVTSVSILQNQSGVANATGAPWLIQGQTMGGSGTITGSLVTIAGGDATGPGATNEIGGKLVARGGDAGNTGSSSNVGADVLVREGHGTGTGAKDGNISIHADAASFNAMQRGIFVGNAPAAPTGNPVAGVYMYATTGVGLLGRGAAGTITTMAPN